MSQEVVMTPDDYHSRSIIGDWVFSFRMIREYRDLVHTMVHYALLEEYKKSLLGILWIVLNPAMAVILWVLLHSAGIFKPGDTEVPYVAYVLLSTSMWTFFVSFYKGVSDTIKKEGKSLQMNAFPKIIIVWRQVLVACVNFIIPLVLSILVLMLMSVKFKISGFLFIPAIIPLVMLGIGLGLVFAVLKLVAIDFTTFFDGSFELLKYLTPVVYSKKVDSALIQSIIQYNPLTYLIDVPRNLLLGIEVTDWQPYIYCSIGAFIFLILALRFFYLTSTWAFEKLTL